MNFTNLPVTGEMEGYAENQDELLDIILDSSWLEFCIDSIDEQENSDELFKEFCKRVENQFNYKFNFTYEYKGLKMAVFEPYNN